MNSINRAKVESLLAVIDPILSKYKGKVFISGSLALAIQGVDLGREIKDIDMVMTEYPLDFEHTLLQNEEYEANEYHFQFERDGQKIDLFIDEKPDTTTIYRFGKSIKCIERLSILKYKLELATMDNKKQAEDIIRLLTPVVERN